MELDWSDADMVFANSTVFSNSLMAAVEEQSRGMAVGSFVVTTTRPLPKGPCFEVVAVYVAPMSWGKATVYVHRKGA